VSLKAFRIKDGAICDKKIGLQIHQDPSNDNVTSIHQTHLQSQLNRAEYLLLTLLVGLQSIKQVRLETLATALPLPITFNSRRKKTSEVLSLPQLEV